MNPEELLMDEVTRQLKIGEAIEHELDGLLEIAHGKADTPDYTEGGGAFPSIPAYADDVFEEFERLHSMENALDLTSRVTEELRDVSKSPTPGRARSIRDAAERYIESHMN